MKEENAKLKEDLGKLGRDASLGEKSSTSITPPDNSNEVTKYRKSKRINSVALFAKRNDLTLQIEAIEQENEER